MSENSLISIIIPVYNARDYIAKCLDSLICQSYKNIEIICVDDCSTDQSLNIINDYAKKDSRLKIFSTGQNSGPATARNMGLDNSQGDFIMFCDNDDTYSQNMCELMLNAAKEYDAELVTCKSNIENSSLDKELANYINSNPEGNIKLNDCIKHSINVLLWNKIYRKSIIDKYAIRFPDGVSAEDDAFIMQYVSVISKYCGLKLYLYNHLFRTTSYTNTIGRAKAAEKKFDKIKIIKNMYDFLIKHDIFDSQEEYFKNRTKAELIYMFSYNKEPGDKETIIRLYNDFVKNAQHLDYKKYNYHCFYKRLYKRLNPFRLCLLINKCYWF